MEENDAIENNLQGLKKISTKRQPTSLKSNVENYAEIKQNLDEISKNYVILFLIWKIKQKYQVKNAIIVRG